MIFIKLDFFTQVHLDANGLQLTSKATLATLARHHPPTDQEEARLIALDRFGQIVTAVLAGGRTKPDKELELLMRKLPDNRLVQLVMKTYF